MGHGASTQTHIVHISGSGNVVNVGPNENKPLPENNARLMSASPFISLAAIRTPFDNYVYTADTCISVEDHEDVLPHLQHKKLDVTCFIPNSMLKNLATNTSEVTSWVEKNIESHPQFNFTHVVVGDMSLLSPQESKKTLVPAMKNIQECLNKKALEPAHTKDHIKVTTMVGLSNFSTPFEFTSQPSTMRFNSDEVFKEVLDLLKSNDAPLITKFVASDLFQRAVNVSVKNYLFDEDADVYLKDDDGKTEYKYVFDAVVDSFHGAMTALGEYGGVNIVPATGWLPQPGKKDPSVVENAVKYTERLTKHIHIGTRKRPGFLETAILHEEMVVKHFATFLHIKS